jgi:hypothetical protein
MIFWNRAGWTWVLLVFAVGCRTFDPNARPVATPDPPAAERVLRVPIYAGEPVYFVGGSAAVDRRQVDRVVRLPALAAGLASVTLELTLSCPRGGCDPWDRTGYVAIVQTPSDTASAPGTAVGEELEEASVLEVLRFVTPYGVGGRWSLDVRNLLPWLHGQRTFRLFIDTWVGSLDEKGSGWQADVTLYYRYSARPPPKPPPIAVYPLWVVQNVGYGDPAITVADQVTARRVRIPETAGRVEIRAFVTGHGQGNADNCAEFCAREHTLRVGDVPFRRTVWRADCDSKSAARADGYLAVRARRLVSWGVGRTMGGRRHLRHRPWRRGRHQLQRRGLREHLPAGRA